MSKEASLIEIRSKILENAGADEEEVADFVVSLYNDSSSLNEFKSSLEEVGAEFASDFIEAIYLDLNVCFGKNQSIIKKEDHEPVIPKKEDDPTPNHILSLPNDYNSIKKEEDYDGENLLHEWKDFKTEDDDDVKLPTRNRSRSPYRDERKPNFRDRGTPQDEEVIRDKIYSGRVMNITNFGAFVRLYGVKGGVDGLVHISAIDKSRINHPSDILKRDQEVYVKVVKVEGNRIGLSMKDVDQYTGESIQIYQNDRRGRELHVTTTSNSKRRLTSPEKWEIRQLIAAGAVSAKDYPDLDKEDHELEDEEDDGNQAAQDIDVELKHSVPPFLAGMNIETEKLAPAKVVKLPEGSLNRAAMSGSALAKERREQKIKEMKEKREQQLKDKANKATNNDDPLTQDQVPDEEKSSDYVPKRDKNVSYGKRTDLSMKEQRESLPVFKMRSTLMKAVSDNQFIVIVGETGSGKTTQLTQYLYEDGFANRGVIGCTQPRRVAAQSVARRVADEVGCRVGQEVGYTVRFDDLSSPKTKIKYMTDGMLQREALIDPDMSNYSVIMLDEAHERTIATDVLFALLKEAASRRPDLKIIVTSATLDAGKFSGYFNNCPIVEIPGRTYPVEILYTKEPELDYLAAALDSVVQIHISEPEGDILVFLTGQEEIETSVQVLNEKMKALGSSIPELIVLPVYSALPSETQSRIFEPTPKGSRKVILATNIAETSLTIDGIYYVIDPGFSKINAYDPKLGMDSLTVRPISQAQANQRAGRAGRTGPGKCFRLYTELAYQNEMLPNTIPEIQRQNLSNVILMLKAIGINDLLNFQFMDPPSTDSILLSLNELYYLKAVDEESRITTIGRNLVNIPADPTISKTLIESIHYKCSDEMITIFAVLSTPNIFNRPKQQQELADKKKARFHHPHGDHLTYLNVYNAWVNNDYSKQWCQENFIQERSLKRAQDVRNQLIQIFKRFKYPIISCGANTNSVRKALCSGFFKNVAKRDQQEGYKTLAEETQVYIHPSSCVRNNPQYVVYNSILNTTKEYLVHVTQIEPKWLVEVSPEFFEVNTNPGQNKKRANEKIVPLFNKFTKDQNEWRLSQGKSGSADLKKRFRA
ncbi:ATP-dependent RNA helicase [Wickerhamomyces ciferrii]|uniref:ATP-dependent RNA helicase n=1 Tax=Wickerhamomyces ciferrii (strain ATCC 14091 / BCRC 22168 / CBS 111 / JCM 3599 / NBRC 0793 / NRRL Y-1031 F-60-10) TaxID=1206466 RepID=K0KH24_WICCF|nr:ATP-dependent RNA helicase [Wickerhamomyces ciferrii]CCH41487.1 ATP-dependent RNA helicase [Wickerhamomyces ciferrii]